LYTLKCFHTIFLPTGLNCTPLSSLAKFKVDDGDIAGAKEYLLQAISEDPKLGFAWNNLGVVNLMLGGDKNLSAAVECMRQAVSLKPDDVGLQMNFANILVKAGSPEEAIPYFKTVIANASSDATKTNATANLGTALFNAGRVEEAIPYLKTASDTGNNPSATAILKIAEETAEKNLIQRQINPTPPTPQPPSE